MEWTPANGWRLSTIDLQQVVDTEVEQRLPVCPRGHEGDPMTPTDEASILKYAISGRPPEWITMAMHCKQTVVDEILETYGYPDKAKMQWGVDELLGDQAKRIPTKTAPRPAPAPTPGYRDPGRVVPPTRPQTGQPAGDTAAQLGWGAVLTRAANSKRAATRNHAARIETQLQALAERLAVDGRAQAAKVRAAHERQKALDEVAAAKAAYEAALAKARGARTPKPKPHPKPGTDRAPAPNGGSTQADRLAQLGASTADIRAWALANGHQIPTRGILRTETVDAYAAAHPGTAQAS